VLPESVCPESADAFVEHEPDAVASQMERSAGERRVGHVHSRGLAANRFHHKGQDLLSPILWIVSSSAVRLAEAAIGLGALKVRGAGIFSEYTVIELHNAAPGRRR